MTNKESSTVTDAMKKIIDEEKPEIITTDIGSEYISQNYQSGGLPPWRSSVRRAPCPR